MMNTTSRDPPNQFNESVTEIKRRASKISKENDHIDPVLELLVLLEADVRRKDLAELILKRAELAREHIINGAKTNEFLEVLINVLGTVLKQDLNSLDSVEVLESIVGVFYIMVDEKGAKKDGVHTDADTWRKNNAAKIIRHSTKILDLFCNIQKQFWCVVAFKLHFSVVKARTRVLGMIADVLRNLVKLDGKEFRDVVYKKAASVDKQTLKMTDLFTLHCYRILNDMGQVSDPCMINAYISMMSFIELLCPKTSLFLPMTRYLLRLSPTPSTSTVPAAELSTILSNNLEPITITTIQNIANQLNNNHVQRTFTTIFAKLSYRFTTRPSKSTDTDSIAVLKDLITLMVLGKCILNNKSGAFSLPGISTMTMRVWIQEIECILNQNLLNPVFADVVFDETIHWIDVVSSQAANSGLECFDNSAIPTSALKWQSLDQVHYFLCFSLKFIAKRELFNQTPTSDAIQKTTSFIMSVLATIDEVMVLESRTQNSSQKKFVNEWSRLLTSLVKVEYRNPRWWKYVQGPLLFLTSSCHSDAFLNTLVELFEGILLDMVERLDSFLQSTVATGKGDRGNLPSASWSSMSNLGDRVSSEMEEFIISDFFPHLLFLKSLQTDLQSRENLPFSLQRFLSHISTHHSQLQLFAPQCLSFSSKTPRPATSILSLPDTNGRSGKRQLKPLTPSGVGTAISSTPKMVPRPPPPRSALPAHRPVTPTRSIKLAPIPVRNISLPLPPVVSSPKLQK